MKKTFEIKGFHRGSKKEPSFVAPNRNHSCDTNGQKYCRLASLGAVAMLCVSSNKKGCLHLPPAAARVTQLTAGLVCRKQAGVSLSSN